MYSINSIPLYILSFTFLLHSVIGADPLYHICSSNSVNYTSGSPFDNNLNTLFNQLSVKVPPTGYGLSSVGSKVGDTVHGLALCRGDVSNADCKTCINSAIKEIENVCPSNKAAIIWYDDCLLKYSDVNFFGTIDTQNKFYLYNTQNVNDTASFNLSVKELLSDLSAIASQSQRLYAAGEMSLLRGLVQCTRDLSSSQCKKCLDDAITELPSCCDGKRGGRVVGGSCNFRYELYPFFSL
ncbi:Cysteine-rich repeat secretory protein [Thalictrum thalictroides]|uniref:Cysteine-rich repeat secretory protein n=1 Tax=Thalictrum thalictroides TaxID=46969 RepID=A0A7J6W1S0_THATH|nr:Cysteine-rich repeat secretory protein [Thalictrum thalictroides]